MPNVTKNGVFIFDGNPADYHEWEFRTELRIVAFEQQEKRRKKKNKKQREVAPVSSSDDDGAVEAVLKVMEGSRGDAFQKAKDFGITALSGPDGLRTLIKEIKAMVFPLKTLEARSFQEWSSY